MILKARVFGRVNSTKGSNAFHLKDPQITELTNRLEYGEMRQAFFRLIDLRLIMQGDDVALLERVAARLHYPTTLRTFYDNGALPSANGRTVRPGQLNSLMYSACVSHFLRVALADAGVTSYRLTTVGRIEGAMLTVGTTLLTISAFTSSVALLNFGLPVFAGLTAISYGIHRLRSRTQILTVTPEERAEAGRMIDDPRHVQMLQTLAASKLDMESMCTL
ncbi:MAG: hypothetical protein Q7S22_06920 [Candidatus Micrarchaeota archaeon]|nr:hypothetical protein [Candidatus Micrarchaeota archaeon]